MRALFEARLEHLGPGDLVIVECVCRHVMTLTAAMLTTAGVKVHELILDLQHKLRCRECDERGKVLVSVRWYEAPVLGQGVNSLPTTTPFSRSIATPLRRVGLAYPCSA
jgi:hypothetical protein